MKHESGCASAQDGTDDDAAPRNRYHQDITDDDVPKNSYHLETMIKTEPADCDDREEEKCGIKKEIVNTGKKIDKVTV